MPNSAIKKKLSEHFLSSPHFASQPYYRKLHAISTRLDHSPRRAVSLIELIVLRITRTARVTRGPVAGRKLRERAEQIGTVDS